MCLTASLVDWWGLSVPQTLVLVALILMILDVLFQSDLATIVGYTLISVAVALWMPFHPLFRILIGLVAWGFLVYFHYTLWRELLAQLVNRVVAPTRYRTGAKGLVGTTAAIKQIDGNQMVSAQGDLWPFHCADDLSPNSRVRIVGERGGVLEVEILKEEG